MFVCRRKHNRTSTRQNILLVVVNIPNSELSICKSTTFEVTRPYSDTRSFRVKKCGTSPRHTRACARSSCLAFEGSLFCELLLHLFSPLLRARPMPFWADGHGLMSLLTVVHRVPSSSLHCHIVLPLWLLFLCHTKSEQKSGDRAPR